MGGQSSGDPIAQRITDELRLEARPITVTRGTLMIDTPPVQSKEANLTPLWAFRLELVEERRKAASRLDRAAALKAQADLDRALADELKSAH